MEEKLNQLNFDILLKSDYDYLSYQCELYYRKLNGIRTQNIYSLIESIHLENNSDINYNDLRLNFNFSNKIIEVSDVHISIIPQKSKSKITENIYTKIDTLALFDLTEEIASNLEVRLLNEENEILQSKIYNIFIKPINESNKIANDYSMLASFVTPNIDGINLITAKAIESLRKIRKNNSFVGYQANDVDSVREEMMAIFNTLKEHGIVYSNPPASFNEFQKVRTPSEVLHEYKGTCLDLAILYCSCLENIGLNPILITIKGHAFAGCFLDDSSFIKAECNDIGLVYNQSSKTNLLIELVECTLFASSAISDFNEATRTARQHITLYNGEFSAIDIVSCHKGIYRPLPIKKQDEEGNWKIETEVFIGSNHLDKSSYKFNKVNYENVLIQKDKFSYWSKKLLDLSLRNKLINFKLNSSAPQLLMSSSIPLLIKLLEKNNIYLQPLEEELADDFYVHSESLGSLYEELAIKDIYTVTCFENQLKTLFRKANSAIEETGSNDLYLSVGLIKFVPKNSKKSFMAPIFLIPVRGKLRRSSKGFELSYEAGEISLNTTIFEYIKQNHQISFDELYSFDKNYMSIDDIISVFSLIGSKTCEDCSIQVDENKTFISIFSFANYIMWDDITNRKDDLLKNEIIKDLVEGVVYDSTTSNNTDNLDNLKKPEEVAIPLGADSSQIKAIIDCADGKSFVLDGPPGTGKSQTIVNMIVNAFYNGKSVLFIAEKMAALEVVKKRIDDINLGYFCLELHSNKANKKNVLEQIKKALENERIKAPDDFLEYSNLLKEKRDELNKLIKKTHELKFLDTLANCIIKYESLKEYDPKITDNDKLYLTYTNVSINNILDLVNDLKSLSSIRGEYSKNPFYAFLLDNYSFSKEADIINLILKLKVDIKVLENNFIDFKKTLSSDLINSRFDIEVVYEILKLIYSNDLSFNTLFSEEIYEKDEINKEVISKGIVVNKIYEKLILNFKSDIFNFDANKTSILLNSIKHKKIRFFFAKKKIIKELKRYLLTKKYKINEKELFNILDSLNLYNNNVNFISNNSEFLYKLFEKDLFDSYSKINLLYDNTLNFKILIDKIICPKIDDKIALIIAFKNIKSNISNSDIENYKIKILINDFNNLINSEENLNKDFLFDYNLIRQSNEYFSDYENEINTMLDNINRINDISSLNGIINKLKVLNVHEKLIDDLKSGKVYSYDFEKYFLCYFYYNLIFEYFNDSYFTEFNGLLFNQAINKYNTLLDDYTALVIKETASRVTKNFPTSKVEYAKSTMIYNLQKCIKNGGYKTTIRNILNDFEPLIRQICPCFLMSPLSAAQYLSVESKKFDIVIFDEASQIPTSEAIGAISRGNSLIVAGDPEQMPPTNFFKANITDDEIISSSQNYDDLESLLEDSLALGLPRNRLLWHYRSQHESLIAFSNNNFYDNKLYTFPSPDDKISKVKFNYLADSIYESGINKKEANAIFEEVKRRFDDPVLCKKSIGIVTFNIKQQELILDMINDLLDENPKYNNINEENTDKIFVKNLENVQGDERDVIMFSIGFGYNKDNKFNLSFGPLSLDKGERRLNVAVTRARSEMIVFSSIKAIDINSERAKNKGAETLKQFLLYAENGKDTIVVENSKQIIVEPGIEKFIQKDLFNLGYESDINVGNSLFKVDLCLKDKFGNYILGVICDSSTYCNSPTCRDRNYVQGKVLKRLKWNIIRVYTLDYFKYKNLVLNDIINALNNEVKETSDKPMDKITFEKEEFLAYKRLNKYVVYSPSKKYNYESLQYEDYYPELVGELTRCIDIEGPICEELLLERFKDILDISKAGSRVKRIFDLNIRMVNRLKNFENGSYIYYPIKDNKCDFYRVSSIQERGISLIPPCEIKAALVDLLELQGAINKNEIIRIIGNTFGLKNVTSTTEQKITEVVNYILDNNNLFLVENDYIKLRIGEKHEA